MVITNNNDSHFFIVTLSSCISAFSPAANLVAPGQNFGCDLLFVIIIQKLMSGFRINTASHILHPRGREELNSPEFKAELQQVVDTLRETVLKDLSSMRHFCYENGGKIPGGWSQNYGYVVETEHYEYCLRCNPVPGDYQAHLLCYDLNEQKINHAYQPLIGRVHFINGDARQFTDAKEYLDCVREELPYRATSGFSFRTVTQDPTIRKAADDIVRDFFDVEEDDLSPSVEIQMGGM